MVYIAGLDVGSFLTKAVIMDDEGIRSYSIRPTGCNFYEAAQQVLAEALDRCGLSADRLTVVGATGMGASFVVGPSVRNTDISCHARGIHYLLPKVKNVIEIGNQSVLVIKLTERGKIADCVSNDKCATGSGRILQMISKILRVSLAEMGNVSLKSLNPIGFSTGCAVFAETEAISRIAEGARLEDIVAGIHQAMAVKICSMTDKVKIDGDMAITGGGACDRGLLNMLENLGNWNLLVPDKPLITGAIGAAIMATEHEDPVP